jgi:hypothetical protein
MRFGELVGTLITAAMERDLLRQASYMNMAAFNREQDSINYLIMKFSCMVLACRYRAALHKTFELKRTTGNQ